MANDDIFIATPDWQEVQANAIDITDGIFSVTNLQNRKIYFQKTTTQPNRLSIGTSFLSRQVPSLKYSITSPEKLFCRVARGTAKIGVLEA